MASLESPLCSKKRCKSAGGSLVFEKPPGGRGTRAAASRTGSMSVPDVCSRQGRLEPSSSCSPKPAKLVTALRHSHTRALETLGSPPGGAASSGSGWNPHLPCTAGMLLPACVCQVVVWLFHTVPACSRASGVPEGAEIIPDHPGCAARPENIPGSSLSEARCNKGIEAPGLLSLELHPPLHPFPD